LPTKEACRKGGLTTYQKYPHIFENGRMKGLQKLLELHKKHSFDIDLELSTELCEFIGAFIGDGFTRQYRKHYLTQFTGDARYESEYFKYSLAPIARRFFNISPSFKTLGNTLRMNFYSKSLYLLLTKRFHMPPGRKNLTIRIPDEIMEGEYCFIAGALRGIADTEGTVYFDLRPIYNTPYPRIQICTTSRPLVRQIKEILASMKYSIYVREDNRAEHPRFYVEIYGLKQLQKWLREIGFSNKKHLDKIRQYAPVAQLVDYQR
jgi:hypothetical protein